MRISKLARNYDLSIQELTAFLEKLEIPNQSLHPNAKLDKETIEKVALHFGFSVEEEITDIAIAEQDFASLKKDCKL